MRFVITALLLFLTTAAYAKDNSKIDRLAPTNHQTIQLDSLKWGDDPSLPKGGKVAIVTGNPGKAGVFIAYAKLPANYVIPAHTHPFAEVITVIKGRIANGYGKKFDRSKAEWVEQGSSFILPANHAHYLYNDKEVIVLLVATGPWGLTYIDPKDDPRNQ